MHSLLIYANIFFFTSLIFSKVVKFPAVTVCNQNPIKIDRLEKAVLEKVNSELLQLLEKEQGNRKGTLIIQFPDMRLFLII